MRVNPRNPIVLRKVGSDCKSWLGEKSPGWLTIRVILFLIANFIPKEAAKSAMIRSGFSYVEYSSFQSSLKYVAKTLPGH